MAYYTYGHLRYEVAAALELGSSTNPDFAVLFTSCRRLHTHSIAMVIFTPSDSVRYEGIFNFFRFRA